ncbi:Acyl-lipid, partial [Bienertia sinuspersici]
MIFVTVYGVLFSNNFWVHIACGGLLGFSWILGIIRINIAWWKWTHNAHHIAVNSLDFDPDLQHMPFFRNVPNRAQELLGLLICWIWYPLLVSCLPNWYERIPFVVASFAITRIQHVQFLGVISLRSKLVGLSISIVLLGWTCYSGGQRFKVAHHLFPRVPKCHLNKISPFVKELCKKHNLPYNCASFWKANALIFNTLRNAALQARDLSNPVPKNL